MNNQIAQNKTNEWQSEFFSRFLNTYLLSTYKFHLKPNLQFGIRYVVHRFTILDLCRFYKYFHSFYSKMLPSIFSTLGAFQNMVSYAYVPRNLAYS